MQPLVLSPKVWMCMPRSALASLPETFQLMVVSAASEACSKVTVPLTLESPRMTATAGRVVSYWSWSSNAAVMADWTERASCCAVRLDETTRPCHRRDRPRRLVHLNARRHVG